MGTLLNYPNRENISFDNGTADKILDAIKSLRMLLKNPHIHITTSQLLFEIKGITDLLNRSDLDISTVKDEKKILGSMKNLRKKLDNEEDNMSEDILEEINGLLCKIDIKSFRFDKNTNTFVAKNL